MNDGFDSNNFGAPRPPQAPGSPPPGNGGYSDNYGVNTSTGWDPSQYTPLPPKKKGKGLLIGGIIGGVLLLMMGGCTVVGVVAIAAVGEAADDITTTTTLVGARETTATTAPSYTVPPRGTSATTAAPTRTLGAMKAGSADACTTFYSLLKSDMSSSRLLTDIPKIAEQGADGTPDVAKHSEQLHQHLLNLDSSDKVSSTAMLLTLACSDAGYTMQ